MAELMHVFGDRPFVDHYLWWPPLTQEINRPLCYHFGTKLLSTVFPKLFFQSLGVPKVQNQIHANESQIQILLRFIARYIRP